MKAITIKRPWAQAIAFGPKRIENRGWKATKNIIGKEIAIHAGKRFDKRGYLEIVKSKLWTEIHETEMGSGIIAVATLKEIVDESDDPWFTGPFGFVFCDVKPLVKSVPCRGQLGFWNVPSEVLEKMEVSK
jgi:hypothetical protein